MSTDGYIENQESRPAQVRNIAIITIEKTGMSNNSEATTLQQQNRTRGVQQIARVAVRVTICADTSEKHLQVCNIPCILHALCAAV